MFDFFVSVSCVILEPLQKTPVHLELACIVILISFGIFYNKNKQNILYKDRIYIHLYLSVMGASGWADWVWKKPTKWLEPVAGHLPRTHPGATKTDQNIQYNRYN